MALNWKRVDIRLGIRKKFFTARVVEQLNTVGGTLEQVAQRSCEYPTIGSVKCQVAFES